MTNQSYNHNRNFPQTRLRRHRQMHWIRNLTQEHTLSPADLIHCVILKDGTDVREDVPHMPGVQRLSIDHAVTLAKQAYDLGIPALALFPYTRIEDRDENGSEAINPDNLMCRAAIAIKDAVPEIGLICDVALDPYTDHGHDGLMEDGDILNDDTVEILCQQAINQAAAGYDIVAPSDMMDGRISAIRHSLDMAGLPDKMIMSYAVKYASAFYGPYRDAIGSKGVLQGDKRTYQMNPANSDEGMHEVALDLEEGADSVMVKPGMPYLDMVRRVKDTFHVPTFAFQVSGEYAMIHAAAANGAIDLDAVVMESLMGFKRAGADGVLTYFGIAAAKAMQAK